MKSASGQSEGQPVDESIQRVDPGSHATLKYFPNQTEVLTEAEAELYANIGATYKDLSSSLEKRSRHVVDMVRSP
jgi:hypothetical protein